MSIMSGIATENLHLAVVQKVLWYISYPFTFIIYYLFTAVLALAHILYQPIGFLIRPLIHLVHFLLVCAAAPFHLLAKFEVRGMVMGIIRGEC